MTTTKQVYNCWFSINQDQKERDFENLENEASRIFLDFILNKQYGNGIGLFRFDIYIKPIINYGRHWDRTYTSCAHLNAHIDKQTFEKSGDQERIKLLLTASFFMIKYLAEKLPLPKGFVATDLVNDYERYLSKHSLLIPNALDEKIIFKHFETTRFNFIRTETIEVDGKRIHFDLNEIEDEINNNIAGKTFGKSLNTIDFGFELYDFDGAFADFMKKTEGQKRYGTKMKNYLVVKHFDYSVIKDLDAKNQFGFLRSKILESINDIDTLSTKPKDFDKSRFYETIDRILTEYGKKQGH